LRSVTTDIFASAASSGLVLRAALIARLQTAERQFQAFAQSSKWMSQTPRQASRYSDGMSLEQQLTAAIIALESQRAVLGDAAVDLALTSIRAKLSALQPPPAARTSQQLRQATILFVDVVGSTALSDRLDPEEIHAVMDGALEGFSAIVNSHHGKVLQYAGDSLLAVFGASEAKEDDAERAVRCGLAVLAHSAVLSEAPPGGRRVNVRVGIHTGRVLLGGGVDAERSIRGIAVNIAARLEQTAPTGTMRISQDTYTLVRGLFEVVALEPLSLKGLAESVQSYQVLRAKPRSSRIIDRGIEGVDTRTIDRSGELASLKEAFNRLVCGEASARKLIRVTISGEAGVGKSRLLYEFQSWAETRPERFYLFRGRATPQSEGQPFALLRDILAWRFQIADDDAIATARAKVEEGIVPLFARDGDKELARSSAHLLGHLVGVDFSDSPHVKGILGDPGQIRNRAFHVAAQFFRRLTAIDGIPIVLELEDLHWADRGTLDFLSYLDEVDSDVPMLVLALSRSAGLDHQPDQDRGTSFRMNIHLEPLGQGDSSELADELLKNLPEIPPVLRDLLTHGAEGNPFYMEELVSMLIDKGAIVVGPDGWMLDAERLLATRVPATLTAVLLARLDSLPGAERLALQQASVIGPVFWDKALIAIDGRAKEALPSLVRRKLVLPRDIAAQESSTGDLREYAFRHHLLYQVVYDTLLKGARRDWHAKVAVWLASQEEQGSERYVAAAAEHYEEAGDEANAAEFHARAAHYAMTRFAHDAVRGHVRRGLDILDRRGATPESQQLRWRLLEAREHTNDVLGERDAQRTDLEALQALAEQLGGGREAAHAGLRCGTLALRVGDLAGTEDAARRAMACAERAGEHELRLLAQRMVAWAVAHRGAWDAGESLTRDTLREARARGFQRVEAYCLNSLAVIAAARDDPVATLDASRQTLAIFHAIGDTRNEAITRANVGTGWMDLGDLPQAKADLEEGLRLLRINGDHGIECSVLAVLSRLASWQGDHERALALAQDARSAARKAPSQEPTALMVLGDAQMGLQRFEEAKRAYEESFARAVELGSPHQHDAAAALARAEVAQGDAPAACRAIARLLVHGPGGEALIGTDSQRFIELTCYQVLDAAGDPEADKWLEHAHTEVLAGASRISDPSLRQSFLSNVPYHRDIVEAWRFRNGASESERRP
jgi:class 3 adenylate cyclase